MIRFYQNIKLQLNRLSSSKLYDIKKQKLKNKKKKKLKTKKKKPLAILYQHTMKKKKKKYYMHTKRIKTESTAITTCNNIIINKIDDKLKKNNICTW